MKASEVIKRYKANKRDFSGVNIRGQSFKGENLTRADFSGAYIQGTNFTNANLTEVKFIGAKAGLRQRWAIALVIALLILSTLSGFPLGLTSWWLTFFFLPETIQHYTHLPGVIVLGMLLVFLHILTSQVLETALGNIAIFGTVAVAGAGLVIVTISPQLGVGLGVSMAAAAAGGAASSVAGAAAIAGAAIGAGRTSALVVAVGSMTTAGTIAAASSVAVAKAAVVATTATMEISGAGNVATLMAGSGAVASIFLSAYIGWRTLNGDQKYGLILKIAITFAAINGTSFRGADLTNANFTEARLKSTQFSNTRQSRTNLTHVCWSNAKDLDYATVGDSILANPAVRKLLLDNVGENKSYKDADLSGANLKNARLTKANLKRANLSGATLEEADLSEANMTAALAIGTDFTGTHLTGACLESWNIDHTTKLTDVDCQYIYLLEKQNKLGHRERRPHNPDTIYKEGDFEKIYQKTIHVVQILLRDGINIEAFSKAFENLMEENPGITGKSVLGIEKKGNDLLLTLSVSELANKGKIEQIFVQEYKDALRKLKNVETENKQLQEERDTTKNKLWELAIIPKYQGEKITVNENIDQSQTFRDVNITASENAVVSLREISGNVTNMINELRESSETEAPSLANLLGQLKTAIESEQSGLTYKDKIKALKHLNNLGKLGGNRKNPDFKDMAEDALDALPTILNRGTGLLEFIKEHFGTSPEAILETVKEILGLIA